MNTNTKSGFSLMELLIVMVILAGLATMIIPNMSSGTEAAKLTSMRNDARNTISTLQAKYIDTQNYANVFTDGDYADDSSESDGIAQTTLSDGSGLPVSANNTITLATVDCDGGTGNAFSISVANSQVPGKTVVYNSCDDGKISVSTGASN